MSTVTGTIVVPDPAPTVAATRAVVRIREVTWSDAAPAEVAAAEMVVDVAPGARIPFSLDVTNVDTSGGRSFNLDVHIDLDGSGVFSPGDLISMDLHPVLGEAASADVVVPVSLIP